MFNRAKQWATEQRDTQRELRARTLELKAWVKAHQADEVASVAGLHVFPDRIITLPAIENITIAVDSRPIAGVEASLQQTGTVYARTTLTRAATVGNGWQKKNDDREAWLQIDGPDFHWTITVPQHLAGKAARAAAEISRLGRQAAAS